MIITAADAISYPATRIDPDGQLTVDTDFRNCHTAHFEPGDSVYELLMAKIIPKVSEFNENYDFEYFPESQRMVPVINVNRYGEGGGFIAQHTDVGGFEGTENCKLSLSILLNDDFEGGEFFIFTGARTFPLQDAQAGDVCVFPSFYVHSVRPVLKGARYTAIVWLRGPRFR